MCGRLHSWGRPFLFCSFQPLYLLLCHTANQNLLCQIHPFTSFCKKHYGTLMPTTKNMTDTIPMLLPKTVMISRKREATPTISTYKFYMSTHCVCPRYDHWLTSDSVCCYHCILILSHFLFFLCKISALPTTARARSDLSRKLFKKNGHKPIIFPSGVKNFSAISCIAVFPIAALLCT